MVSFQVNGAREYLGLYTGDDTNGDVDVAKLNDVSFADDLAYVIAALAEQLLASLALAACIMWRVYEECGFRLNWGPTKTAAVLKWVGPDSRLWCTKVEQELKSVLTVRRDTREAQLAIVSTYKHVGTHCPINCGLGVEVNLRAGTVWGKLKPLVRKLYRSTRIRLDIKRQALQAFFLSSQLSSLGAGQC